MALDANGKPIPVYTPDPKAMSALHMPRDVAIEQIALLQATVDRTLKSTTEQAQRMAALEEAVGRRVDAAIHDLDHRFNEIMQTNLAILQRQFDAMSASFAGLNHSHPPPEPAPDDPRATAAAQQLLLESQKGS